MVVLGLDSREAREAGPLAPRITRLSAGDRQITLEWAPDRESDLAEYRVYRAADPDHARDVSRMDLVHTVPAATGDPAARPARLSWTDRPVPGLRDLWYRVVAVGNASAPSPAMRMRAFELAPPAPPATAIAGVPDEVPGAVPHERAASAGAAGLALPPALAPEPVPATLDALKAKWFVPLDGSAPCGVPCHRAEGSGPALSASTDHNLVTPLLDGQAYMQQWHDSVVALHAAPGAELYHAGWRFEAVDTLGTTSGGPDALHDAEGAAATGARCYPLLCRNVGMYRFNFPSLVRLRLNGISAACLDSRFPPGGSNHQKFAVMKSAAGALAMLGSIDIAKPRWDTSAHRRVDPDRDPSYGKQTHDGGVMIAGPAVVDIEKTFRDRWNDSTRQFGLEPPVPQQPLITTPHATPAAAGTHSVQVLRTYGITSKTFGYSWSPTGEFTVWASYLNAIRRAATYLYIEDQYLVPFDWPPCHSRTGLARDTDLIYQLGEAMKRGVTIVIVTPSNAEDPTHVYQKYQRDVGVNYLTAVRAGGAAGDVIVAALNSGGSDVYVHSKLLIVDDEFVLIGSANVGQRSMTYDSELDVGIVDSAGAFARALRMALWEEHTGRDAAQLADPAAAIRLFRDDVAASAGHLKPYPVDRHAVYPPTPGATPPPIGHTRIMRLLIDPYAGPPELR
ncbi:MAG TPA: phospholipase D family protein [Kofleriaceae bacterium]|nr:phospholipase D family protein [Kofleriaceae bacterium]